MTEFTQSLRLDLANPFPCNGKFLPYLFQRMIGFFADAEAHAQDLLFARRQSRQDDCLPPRRPASPAKLAPSQFSIPCAPYRAESPSSWRFPPVSAPCQFLGPDTS